jgi:von Willebrand factor type A domain/RTX calcium-binding nonapeptide repeat (4 copies)
MPSPIIAQADFNGFPTGTTPVRTIKLQKPQGGQAVTVQLGYAQAYKLDLSEISNEKITLVHIGEKLIILFDNKSTVTVEPFFDSMNVPLTNVTVEASGRDLTSSEFASIFLITTDQSVLTGFSVNLNAPASGANFSGPSVDSLGETNPLPLLGQEELPGIAFHPPLFGTKDAASDSQAAPPENNPLIVPMLSPFANVVHDESAGMQTAADPKSANDLVGSSLPSGILALFNSIGAVQGRDPHISTKDNGAIGFAVSPGNLVTLSGGSQNPITAEYALTVTDSTFSGASTTEGTQIFLYNGTGTTAGLLLGRVGTESGAADTADPAGTVAFALAIDSANGNGYIAQYLSLQNPLAGSAGVAFDDQISLAPGAVQIQVTYGDGHGGLATSTPVDLGQQFGFQDDGPTAGAVTTTITGSGHDTNLMLILDKSGSMASASGLPGLTRLAVLKAAVDELLEQYGSIGNVRVQIVEFSSSASQVGGDWMTIAQAKAAVDALIAGGTTNYDAPIVTAASIFTHVGALSTASVENVSYFMSDGEPNVPGGSVGMNASEESAWIAFLDTNDIDSFALGMGTGATQSTLNPLAFNGQTNTNTDSIVVTDLGQLAATLVGTINTTSGNLLTDGVQQGNYGADGGYVKSITADGTVYTYDPTLNLITAAGTDHGTFDPATHKETVILASGGIFTIDLDDAFFTYGAPSSVSSGFIDAIPFILSDNDGDTAGSTLIMVSTQADRPPAVRDDHVITNITGGSGTSIVIPDFALMFNDSDPDGQTIAVTGISNISSPNSVSHLAANVIFIDDNANGGSFTYTGSTTSPASNDTGDVTVNRAQTGNTLAGTGVDDILIGREGSNNVINANGGNDVLLGASNTDTLIGGAGNDLLVANGGNDTLTGGVGADHFRINAPNDGLDHIVDFSGASGDLIEVLGLAFGGLPAGALNSSQFVSNAGGNFTDGAQQFSFDTMTKTLYYDSDGNGAATKIALAHLENSAHPDSTSFRII